MVEGVTNYPSYGECLLSFLATFFVLCEQGTPVKDVQLPDNPALKSLLLDKHASYIEAFEKDKDDYVNKYQ